MSNEVVEDQNVRVISFIAEGPAKRGAPGNMGLSAVINFGIEPTMYDLIVVKANTSFKEPYSKFAGHICYADTPGAGASNLKQFEWKNIPKGIYPFDK